MLALFRAHEPSGGGHPPRPPRRPQPAYRHGFLSKLRLPCYVCEGSGRLWLTDELWPRGRFIRCVACRGRGTMRWPHA